MKNVNEIINSFGESVFSQMTKLAIEHKAVNLAQGFPDFDGPEWIFDIAHTSFKNKKNQYAPSMGLLNLRQAIANQYQQYYQIQYDPKDEIIVTNGATEALFLTITSLLNPGDEVVMFEPFYDSYLAALKIAKANVKIVTLKAPTFEFDLDELRSALSHKTKLLIMNNPQNPSGKVFTKNELESIASLSEEFDFNILSDEVYEFLTFDCAHIPTAAIKNLKNKTITISSIGKTLSLTGWKIGWAAGPSHLIAALHKLHQFTTFCVATPLQDAIANVLPKLNSYLNDLKAEYLERRDYLYQQLIALNYKPLLPRGSYFILVEVPAHETDTEFATKLIKNKKVASIPASAFYAKSHDGKRYIRFCFAKTKTTLDAALNNLRTLSC